MEVIITVVISSILVIVHEIGHLITARLLHLKIQGFGYKLKPFPSFFVSVKRDKRKWKNLIYLSSGNIITLVLLFVLSTAFDKWNFPLKLAVSLQLIGEYNPFYSDLVFIFLNLHNKHRVIKENIKIYYTSSRFLMLFALWLFVILIILKTCNIV